MEVFYKIMPKKSLKQRYEFFYVSKFSEMNSFTLISAPKLPM